MASQSVESFGTTEMLIHLVHFDLGDMEWRLVLSCFKYLQVYKSFNFDLHSWFYYRKKTKKPSKLKSLGFLLKNGNWKLGLIGMKNLGSMSILGFFWLWLIQVWLTKPVTMMTIINVGCVWDEWQISVSMEIISARTVILVQSWTCQWWSLVTHQHILHSTLAVGCWTLEIVVSSVSMEKKVMLN